MSLVLKCNNCKGIRTFKHGTTHRVGFTLWMLGDKSFVCSNCGHTEAPNFWKERFKGVAPKLSLREASVIIGTTSNGSTLRRAIHKGRLKPLPPNGNRQHTISRGELIRYYLKEHGRNRKRVQDEPNKVIGNSTNMS